MRFLFLSLTCCFSLILAQSVFYISLDGLSNTSFFALMKKGKLATISSLIEDGNARKLASKPFDNLSFAHENMLYIKNLKEGVFDNMSLLDKMKDSYPSMKRLLLLSSPVGLDAHPEKASFFDLSRYTAFLNTDIKATYRSRSSHEIIEDLIVL